MNNPMRRRSLCLTMLSGCILPSSAGAQTVAPLEIGVLPNISARVLLAQYQPMREYLAREMKRPVQVSTAPNWTAFHQRTLGLDYDVVVTAANLARVAQLDRGYVPLLSYAPNIKGLVIFATRRPISSVAELNGQTLALSNPQSLVTLRGMQWLAEKGMQRDKHFKTIDTPTDDSVGSVVVRGDAIAAMVSGGEYRAIPDSIKAQLQVLSTFTEVAGFVVLASPRLPTAEGRVIKEQLQRFAAGSEEGKAFFASSGFTGMHEPPAGLMESMDSYVEATRRVLSAAG
ncbi:MAG: PhnD/SsuA/transferrin family substrate-binding protein [Pseudomonadota bacterium]|nr:PhnD/SsuA/transferrin family substrate-binding protein [Pseudomonadota bacterium]